MLNATSFNITIKGVLEALFMEVTLKLHQSYTDEEVTKS